MTQWQKLTLTRNRKHEEKKCRALKLTIHISHVCNSKTTPFEILLEAQIIKGRWTDTIALTEQAISIILHVALYRYEIISFTMYINQKDAQNSCD